jgi:hypothetical protein
VGFFSRGRRTEGPDEASADPVKAPPAARLSVVEFWTADQRHIVGIDLSHERLTDLLNREGSIRVAMLDMVPEDRSLQVDVRPDLRWANLAVDDSLLVFPPPQASDPHRRLHRPRQPVEIAIGPFEIVGSAHIPPGAQAAGFLMRQSNRFTAITRVVVRDPQLPGFEQRADVLLVNLRRIGTIRDVGLGEVPGPASDASAPR